MKGLAPIWLDPHDTTYEFPDVSYALDEPDGLLAIGGTLCPGRLKSAYIHGIFPWYNEDQPILWWSPNPRCVLFPEKIHISKSLRKTIRKQVFTVTFDQAFDQVIDACRQPRRHESGTWITDEMRDAYIDMHKRGYAHSIETWHNGRLVGGLYGLSFGKVFFGESMFSTITDASKVAFVHLAQQLQAWNFGLIDCQVASSHLFSLGAEEIPRQQFIRLLNDYCIDETSQHRWQEVSNKNNLNG